MKALSSHQGLPASIHAVRKKLATLQPLRQHEEWVSYGSLQSVFHLSSASKYSDTTHNSTCEAEVQIARDELLHEIRPDTMH